MAFSQELSFIVHVNCKCFVTKDLSTVLHRTCVHLLVSEIRADPRHIVCRLQAHILNTD